MQTKTKLLSLLLLFTLAAIPLLTVNAQSTVSLSLYKDYGYGLGNDMAGLWTVNAQVSADVTSVEFYLDDQLQEKDASAPFSWQFDTSNYSIGEHTIKAVAYDASDSNQSTAITRNFVEDNTNSILIIIIAVVVAIFAVAGIVAVYRVKKSKK
ncbi:MAG: Ig-like domain-containing protein [Candidatus Bathyarchaeia archaeon]|jgi:hypothetical protein